MPYQAKREGPKVALLAYSSSRRAALRRAWIRRTWRREVAFDRGERSSDVLFHIVSCLSRWLGELVAPTDRLSHRRRGLRLVKIDDLSGLRRTR